MFLAKFILPDLAKILQDQSNHIILISCQDFARLFKILQDLGIYILNLGKGPVFADYIHNGTPEACE